MVYSTTPALTMDFLVSSSRIQITTAYLITTALTMGRLASSASIRTTTN